MIPVVGTFTGAARALMGLIHSIVHLVRSIFDCGHFSFHMEQVKFGGFHTMKGLAEMVPLLGTAVGLVDSLWFDPNAPLTQKLSKDWKEDKLEDKYKNAVTLFANGKEVRSLAKEEFEKRAEKFSKPTVSDLLEIFEYQA